MKQHTARNIPIITITFPLPMPTEDGGTPDSENPFNLGTQGIWPVTAPFPKGTAEAQAWEALNLDGVVARRLMFDN